SKCKAGVIFLSRRSTSRPRSPWSRITSIQHSLATLARRQALATVNPLLRKQLRDRAKRHLAPLLGSAAEDSYGFHTAAQIALDDLRDILDALDSTNPDPLLVKRLVDTARDFERYVQE